MPDGNLNKVLRIIRQCITRITGGGGLHSRLNQLQASLDTAQSRLRSTGIYSPPIQTALEHAKQAAFALNAYTQTERAWEQAIGTGGTTTATPEAPSTTQTIDTGLRGSIMSGGDAVGILVDVNSQTVSPDAVAAFVQDPAGATRSYAANATWDQVLLDTVDFALTFIPGSALGLGTRAAARTTAESLALTRATRREVAGFMELSNLFEQRAAARAARQAAEQHLKDVMPPGYSMKDFNVSSIDDTIETLSNAGYSDMQVESIREAAEQVTDLRPVERRIAEYIGERGGEQSLVRQGYEIPGPFRSTGVDTPGPGRSRLDGLGVRPDGSEIVFPEYKGGAARVSNKPVQTRFEGPAFQATPAYVRDHMLTDPRMVQYFHDNPHVWQSVKEGRTTLLVEAYSTPAPGYAQVSGTTPFSLTPQIIQAMEEAMATL